MGFMDNFTTDTPVEVKHGEYYNLMKEAAKAELLLNGIKCGVPGEYLAAVATGKMEKILIDETAFTTIIESQVETEEWGAIASAVRGILEEWDNESQVKDMANHISLVIKELADARIKELRMKQYATWAKENEKHCEETWSCNTCYHNRKGKKLPICGQCEDGSKYEPNEEPGSQEQWNCDTCGHQGRPEDCHGCEDGSCYESNPLKGGKQYVNENT